MLVKRDDRLEAGNYEILIGDTNRDTTPEGKIMEYSLVVKHGSVKLNFGGMYTAKIAIEYLMNNLFNGNTFSLAEGTYYKTSYLSSYQNVTSGTTARVMSANVLADAFNTDTKYDKALYRAEIFAGTLITHILRTRLT